MNTLTTKKQSTVPPQPPSPSPLGFGILGALAGAAIGSVAAIYLSEQKNRETLSKQAHLFRDRAIKVMDTFSEQEKEQEKISRKLDDIQEEVHTR